MNKSIFDVTKSDIELSEKYADYKPEFIIDGLIKKLGKNIFAAERGAGKTRVMLFIAYAIIYGCDEVLGYKINAWGDTLFLNLEISEKDFKAFTEPIKNYYEKTLGLRQKYRLHITSLKESGNKLNDLKVVVERYKPMLIIIDSYKLYQSFICMEENQRDINNSNFEKVLRLMDELVSEFNTTIALINHTNKDTRGKQSNADLMFGPGALPDFCDQITLLRKTKSPNQRLIVPDKSRYCAEGSITTNVIQINSTDESSPMPEELFFEVVEQDVDELSYLPTMPKIKNRIPDEIKEEIIDFIAKQQGTYEDAAEKYLGKKNLKGTVAKIIAKHNRNTF